MRPIVTIIVPVYNTEAYLSQCIDSILAQTFIDFELILINDGSTDNSGKICDDYAAKDSRIVVVHKVNGGQSDARNLGLKIARGEYITFVDSDDYYLDKEIISICIKELKLDKQLSFIQFSIFNAERKTNSLNHVLTTTNDMYINWLSDEKVLTNYPWDKIYKKEIFQDISYPVGMIYEDRYIFPYILNRSRKIKIINVIGYYYRQHGNQTIRKKLNDKVLFDKLIADFNILKLMPNHLFNPYNIVYYRALNNYTQLKRMGGKCEFPQLKQNLYNIVFSSIPIGIRTRLSIVKLFGINIYLKIFD